MHSGESEDVKKNVRKYLMIGAALYVFTVITVAINQIHLAVPFAIALGLAVASIKGTMVAAIFMHLNHERWWIYGSLIITVVFFVVLLLVPISTSADHIGTLSDWAAGAAAGAAHGAAEGAGH
jgi:caa(3)-type oxidase subunit IV